MAFIAKNPLIIPEVESPTLVPDPGTRGLFAGEDGWYEIDSEGQVQKIGADLTQEQLDNIDAVPDKADKADLEIISEQVGSIEESMPTKVSDLENDEKFATEGFVKNHIPDYKAMNLLGDENGGYINAMNSENPYKSFLEISTYAMRLAGYSLEFDFTDPATGLKVATPNDENEAVNKRYVDTIVGDVETALETVLDRIIEMQETLIGGEA